MRILALEQDVEGVGPEDFTPDLLRAEAMRAWELQQQGVLREIYFRADRHAAVLLLECNAHAEAEEHLASLPLVQAGLIRFEVIPLLPYPGLARLFVP